MSYNTWLISGFVFVALEFILPGGIAGALGLSTLMIALLVWLGWLTDFLSAMFIWISLVTVSLLILRRMMRKLSTNQTSVGVVSEDETLRGSLVLVTESIPAGGHGRVMIRGTTWMAMLIDPDQSVEVGSYVHLISRNNIVWNVEAIPPLTGEIS